MKTARYLLFFLSFLSCGSASTQLSVKNTLTAPEGHTIEDRFPVPESYERIALPGTSFGYYLRHLPLKSAGQKVKYYNGAEKNKNGVYLAVVDMEIGPKDLQQCADAVIRLRAEYLYGQKLFAKIHFNYTNGFNAEYSKWKEGYRIKVTGNKAEWIKSAEASDEYSVFRKYLDNVFMYAGTLSLSREMKSIPYIDLQPGDVLIQGGSPGHAVIVVDMAVNKSTGKKIYMLAQSYMPAQETQILCNPLDPGSPWYELDAGTEEIRTPEWLFTTSDAKRFAD